MLSYCIVHIKIKNNIRQKTHENQKKIKRWECVNENILSFSVYFERIFEIHEFLVKFKIQPTMVCKKIFF